MGNLLKKRLCGLDNEILSIVREVAREAEGCRCRAYLVGGFVRDLVLKRKNLDLDFVFEGNAIRVAEKFSAAHDAVLTVHKRFKTATVVLPCGLRADFATARKESYPYPGSLPVVEDGPIRDDLYRRDFTINAMAVAINRKNFGELVDYFSGYRDLTSKKIRVMHDKSFIDDPTRILRAVRFEQRFNFEIEGHTLRLLKEALESNVEGNVKPPRYFVEFKKLLQEPKPIKGVNRLAGLRGLAFIDRNFKVGKPVFDILQKAEININSFQRRFKQRQSDSWLVYWMVLIAALPSSRIPSLLQSFHFKREDVKKILLSKNSAGIIRDLSLKGITPSRIYETLKPLSYENMILLSSITSQKIVRRHIKDFLLQYESVKIEISGSDLKEMGMASGRSMGSVLGKILKAKLDGKVRSVREESCLAKKLAALTKG
ncbi:MAG TPA: hypothetical protein PL155_00215 [Candidatus Omnitrophota bacterium]|nr:hypothetical protein [Candidatus Omnitrophota bacterium]HPD85090.1 hypothetical protein [Candidatus Omnitrophota bacterium]HRZ03948.1 hypothetical protein [Candidatus Omnitrophota bacterium]